MITSQKGKAFIESFEQCILHPYLDGKKIATIGVGNTWYPNGKKVTMKDPPITKEFADQMFGTILAMFEKDVNFLLQNHVVTQNQFDALVSFAYNVGPDIDADTIAEGLGDSTLLKKVLANPNDPTIFAEFMKWVSKGTVNEKGLTARRSAEATIYSKGIYVNHN